MLLVEPEIGFGSAETDWQPVILGENSLSLSLSLSDDQSMPLNAI